MSVTVRDCLGLTAFSTGRAVTGENGLDRIVSAVSVLEQGDGIDQTFAPGEMVIASLVSVGQNADSQCRMLHRLWKDGCSALVINNRNKIPGGVDPQAAYAASCVDLPLIVFDEADFSYGSIIGQVVGLLGQSAVLPERSAGSSVEFAGPVGQRNVSPQEPAGQIRKSASIIYAAAQLHSKGASVAQRHSEGASAAQLHSKGASAAQLHSEGTSAVQLHSDGAKTPHELMAERCLESLFAPGEFQRYKGFVQVLDRSPSKGLMETLCAYLLDAEGEIKTASQLLEVHRNTILYRLNSAGSLLGCPVESMPMRYDLTLACGLYRLGYI